MSTLSISYTVPVQVIVNLETGRVTRVVVLDELVEPDESSKGGFYEVVDDQNRVPRQAEIDKAYRLAEDADWPAWDFGW